MLYDHNYVFKVNLTVLVNGLWTWFQTMVIYNYVYIMYFVVICFFFCFQILFSFHKFLGLNTRDAIGKLLQREYYNLNSSGSYFGPSKLHESLKAREINIGTYKISKWLTNQLDVLLKEQKLLFRVLTISGTWQICLLSQNLIRV